MARGSWNKIIKEVKSLLLEFDFALKYKNKRVQKGLFSSVSA
jgi:hypothetical protein